MLAVIKKLHRHGVGGLAGTGGRGAGGGAADSSMRHGVGSSEGGRRGDLSSDIRGFGREGNVAVEEVRP